MAVLVKRAAERFNFSAAVSDRRRVFSESESDSEPQRKRRFNLRIPALRYYDLILL
jgi:phage protein D